MEQIRNPFTPTFGMVPPYLAGRDRVLSDMRRAFSEGLGNPNLATLLVGPRGSGKTALLSCIADEAKQEGWISVNAVALEGMLDDIIQQAGKACAHLVEPAPTRRLSAIGIGQLLNLEWVFSPESQANWRSRIEALLDQIGAHARGLLITVDEVRPEVDELVQLIATYQLLVRDGRQVALVMAGLPAAVSATLNDRVLTFLNRARKISLPPLPLGDVDAFFLEAFSRLGVQIGPEDRRRAAEFTQGSPYMLQLVGHSIAVRADDAGRLGAGGLDEALASAMSDFENDVCETTLAALSDKDVEFLTAMAQDEGASRVSDVAERMGVTVDYAQKYRRRLIDAGVIEAARRGFVRFAVPYLKRHLSRP